MKTHKNKIGHKNDELNVLITFLEITKQEKYAQIEKSSLPYVRIKQESEIVITPEENYYYSIR